MGASVRETHILGCCCGDGTKLLPGMFMGYCRTATCSQKCPRMNRMAARGRSRGRLELAPLRAPPLLVISHCPCTGLLASSKSKVWAAKQRHPHTRAHPDSPHQAVAFPAVAEHQQQ